MRRGPIHDDDHHHDAAVARKGRVVTATGGWPELIRCTTTTPPPSRLPPILLDELIEEILLRIPARSLVRLRDRICSSWRTLISSSQFAKQHLRRSTTVDPTLTHPLIAYFSIGYAYPTIGVFSVPSPVENPPHEPTKVVPYKGRRPRSIIDSCNGLLCLYNVERDDEGLHHGAILWNPCIGSTSQPVEIGGPFSVSGFGYDHVNDKYKLFGRVYKKSGEYVSRIITFGPNITWRTIEDFSCSMPSPHGTFSLVSSVGIFVNGTGTLNWIFHDCFRYVVVRSLDLVKETYNQFPLPDRDLDDDCFMSPLLCILRGCLAACYENKRTHWTVWLMKEYGVPQSWTKLVVIPHHPLLVNPSAGFPLQPIYIFKNNVLLAKAPNHKFVLLNLNDGSIDFPNIDSSNDGMPKLRPLSKGLSSRTFRLYHESLVSLSHLGLQSCSSEMRLVKPSL
ncbi:F-box/kelch-repeat protein At3g23880 [Arachis duranensis]|uniref:F-box/kelch-repeat protein At3g23880 n=1 Tax=Arachis duranensis TaxID=130453 RepID=A0A6P4C0E8_ARADU|nr:F-box/kelch-repeat protein At3g23880 [Arachis duranensis]